MNASTKLEEILRAEAEVSAARDRITAVRKLRQQAFTLQVLAIVSFVFALPCFLWTAYAYAFDRGFIFPAVAVAIFVLIYFLCYLLAQLIYIRAALEDRK